jgi:hypothetical protein
VMNRFGVVFGTDRMRRNKMHQNGVQPPSRNFGGTLGSGLLSLKFAFK